MPVEDGQEVVDHVEPLQLRGGGEGIAYMCFAGTEPRINRIVKPLDG